jgi:hypothetical protein
MKSFPIFCILSCDLRSYQEIQLDAGMSATIAMEVDAGSKAKVSGSISGLADNR